MLTNEEKAMKMAVLLDIDNTLTPPRQQLTQEMTEILNRLRVPFHVAAGSHIALLQEQFFDPLYRFGFRKQFDAFLSLGGVHYRCDYSQGKSIKVISAFDMHDYLGEEDYGFLIDVLTKTLEDSEFQLSHPVRLIGDTITYRGSMINFCPIGRSESDSPEYRSNRDNFVIFDRANGFRQRMLNHLRRELSPLIANRQLTIVLGGETSFDISVAVRDKTYAVRTLLNNGVERIVFIGDALFDGGNDAPIREFAENWPSNTPCPLKTIQVSSWKETIERLYELNVVGAQGE